MWQAWYLARILIYLNMTKTHWITPSVGEFKIILYYLISILFHIDIYASQAQALISGKKCSGLNINKGASVPIFLTSPSVNEKYTKHAGVGQYLQGTITFAKDEAGKKSDVYPIR